MELRDFIAALGERSRLKLSPITTDMVQLLDEEKFQQIDESLRKRDEEIERVNQFKEPHPASLNAIYFGM